LKDVLKAIWLAANLPCSKRLKACIPIWLPAYQQRNGQLPDDMIAKLLAISPPTIDRIFKPVRIKYKKRGVSTTRPGSILRNQIPVKTGQWDETRPGFLEADTVAHCGTSMAGQFIFSLDIVDIATQWTEQRAVWGKGERGIKEQIEDVESSLPFPIQGFDCDNGSEFLNHHLVRYFHDRRNPVQFTRSRAYRKDDNSHIEQKNWTHIRQWLGYDRFDNIKLVSLINDLYTNEWRCYHNFFLPSVKLVDKNRVGSKTIKKFDTPKTPYQRILESPDISIKTKKSLQKQFSHLDPFQLREAMEKRLANIFKLC
jgi:hypothetical protein